MSTIRADASSLYYYNDIHRDMNSSYKIMCDFVASTDISSKGLHWECENSLPKYDICSKWGGIICIGGVIQEIQISYYTIIGTIPSSIGQLVSLTYLHLEGNALSGTIPSSIGDLTQLSDLWLGSNKLVGLIPSSIGNLLALQVLSLSRNCLIGAIPSSISNLRSLRVLWLNSNKLTGTIPSSLSLLSSLYTAYLFANSLTGTIPSSLGAIHKLMALSAYRNYLHGQIPRSFENLHALTSFRIYDNYLTGSLPSELCGHSLVDFYPKRLKEGTADLRIFTDNLLTCYAPCLSSVAFHHYGGIPPCNLSEARRYDAISSVNPSARPTYYPTQPTAARGSLTVTVIPTTFSSSF